MAKKEVSKEIKKTNKKNDKNKKSFFKSFKVELKKVVWPTPKQLINSTTTVITIVLICTAIVFVLDLGFEAINKNGIDKIKESINTKNTQTQEDNTVIVDNNTTSTDENTTQTTQNNVEEPVAEGVQNNKTTQPAEQ